MSFLGILGGLLGAGKWLLSGLSKLAGKLIEDDYLAELLARVLDISADINPSFFEATTAAALLAFAECCIN